MKLASPSQGFQVVHLAWLLRFISVFAFLAGYRVQSVGETMFLSCKSNVGHVSHYYHFYFNCLIPSVIFRLDHPENPIVMCNHHIRHFQSIYTTAIDLSYVNETCINAENIINLDGFDFSKGAGVQEISRKQRIRANRYFAERSYRYKTLSSSKPRLLLIGRGNITISHRRLRHDSGSNNVLYYGAARRSIANFVEIEATLKDRFSNELEIQTVYLEDLNIFEQFWAFRQAAVIVGQHGAGLSNIFFTNNHTKGLIEISPYNSSFTSGVRTHALYDCFEILADSLELPYKRLHQKGEFGEVPVRRVLSVVEDMLALL